MIRPFVMMIAVAGLVSLHGAESMRAAEDAGWEHPLVKQGYLNSPLVEVVPFVWKDELHVLENWRSNWDWPEQPSATAARDGEMWIARLSGGPEKWHDRAYLSRAMAGRTLGTAFVWDGRVYVFGVNDASGRKHVDMTWSDDLLQWSEPVKVFDSPAGQIFNVSVARDSKGFVFLWETNAVGRAFTMCFGRIDSIADTWNGNTIPGARYGADKYTGGPAIYYEGGLYYLLYLEDLGKRRWETRVTRSPDLIRWQDAPPGRPFVTFDVNRRNIPLLAPDAPETNASDAKLAAFKGRVIVYYTGSNQQVGGDLQWATFGGAKQALLERFFEGMPEPNG